MFRGLFLGGLGVCFCPGCVCWLVLFLGWGWFKIGVLFCLFKIWFWGRLFQKLVV